MKVNKLLKMVSSLITLGILLFACTTIPTKKQIDNANYGILSSDYQTIIMGDMSSILFDPYSARYRFGSPYKGYAYVNGTIRPPRFGHLVNVGVNAKNRMGGYVGEKLHTYFFPGDSEVYYRLDSYVERGRLGDASVEETSKKISEDNNSAQKVNGSIIQLKGSGIKNTRPFSVNGPWEIQWDAKGDYFSVYIYTADGSLAGVAANQQGPGKSSSYQPKGGRYYINVNAVGNWEVKVVEVK